MQCPRLMEWVSQKRMDTVIYTLIYNLYSLNLLLCLSVCNNVYLFKFEIDSQYSEMNGTLDLLSCVLVLQKGLRLLFTDDGGLDLWRVHVHVQLPAD